MKLRKFIFIVWCTMIVILYACGNNHRIKSNGLKYFVPNLPLIEDFSSSEYENYEYHFSPVDHAIYHHEGKSEVISANDPRLIRLLNFLAYSDEKSLSVWQQGYIEEDEITSYLASDFRMLEVIFQCDEKTSGSTLQDTPRIVVCGDSYLLFVDTSSFKWQETDGMFADRWWPYGELVLDLITEGKAEDGALSFDGWGAGYWIDILLYSGFN